MKTMNGSCACTKYASDPRNKHKEHWIPFERAKPPSWVTFGAAGIDDKRESRLQPHSPKPTSIYALKSKPRQAPPDRSSFVVEVKASEIVPAGEPHLGPTNNSRHIWHQLHHAVPPLPLHLLGQEQSRTSHWRRLAG